MKKILVIALLLLVSMATVAQETTDSTKKKKATVVEKIVLDRTFSVSDRAILFTKKIKVSRSDFSVYEWTLKNDRIGETNVIVLEVKNKRTGNTVALQSWSDNAHVRMEIYDDGGKAYYVYDDMFNHLMIIPSQETYGIIMNSTLLKK